MLNSTLLKSATKIIENTSPAQFTITAQFINSTDGAKFSLYPFKINKIILNQDYIDSFADELYLEMLVSLKDYALLQDQGQNLLCILTSTYINKYGKVVFDPPPRQVQYNVILTDSRDVRMAVPDSHLYTEPNIPLTVQLIESTVYKLRHTKVNAIYQNMTVEQAIYAITKAFEISKIQMVPLENTHQYDHIDVSSYQSIDSVYRYLQTKFGLYSKGGNSYIANDVLYVYPPFETSPTYDKSVIFYQVDTGRFAGVSVFHQIENKNVSIVINAQPESYDLSVAGSENVGTGFLFTRSSRLTDGFTSIDSKEGVKFTELPALSVVLDTARTVVKDVNNLMHIKSTDNPFPQMSKLISQQASLMRLKWTHADPFQLDPGHAVTYYYDRNEVMVKKTGIVEEARFEFENQGKMHAKDAFSVTGYLTLRLSSNVTMEL